MLINVALTLNAFSQLVGNAGGMGINFCSARIRFPSTFFLSLLHFPYEPLESRAI